MIELPPVVLRDNAWPGYVEEALSGLKALQTIDDLNLDQ